ncbi:hypothetical protein ACLB2K_047344 [Fragaria x ananassa]
MTKGGKASQNRGRGRTEPYACGNKQNSMTLAIGDMATALEAVPMSEKEGEMRPTLVVTPPSQNNGTQSPIMQALDNVTDGMTIWMKNRDFKDHSD